MSRSAFLVSFDVEDLYPNIDHKIAREDVGCYFETGRQRACVLGFLDFVMENNFFEFRGVYYHQVRGTAMGTPAAPPYANLTLACLERAVIDASTVKPRFYMRFIDDGFVIWEGAEDALITFLHAWNTARSGIKITYSISKSEMNDLDLCVYKDMSCQCPSWCACLRSP